MKHGHGMIGISFVLAAALSGAMAPSARSEILFSDNFNRAPNENINADADTSQGGTLKGTSYIFNSDANGAEYETVAIQDNRLATGRNVSTAPNLAARATVDHNFVDAAIFNAGGFTIDVDVTPAPASSSAGRRMTLAVGLTRSNALSTAYAYNAFPAISVVSNANGNANRTATVQFNKPVGTENTNLLTAVTFDNGAQLGETYHLTAIFTGSSFTSGADWALELFIDGTAIDLDGDGNTTSLFDWSNTVANTNYIALERYRDPVGFWDNYQIVAAVPEPATAGLLSAGLLLCARRRRRCR